MKISTNTKILLFDGLRELLATNILPEAFQNAGYKDFITLDVDTLPNKPFYHLRRMGDKIKNVLTFHELSRYYKFPNKTHAWIKKIQDFKPDIVIVLGYYYIYAAPEIMQKLKHKLGFKLVLWDTDLGKFMANREKFEFFCQQELPTYDCILSFSRATIDYFKRIDYKTPAAYLPYGGKLNPVCINTPKNKEAIFVGGANLRRLFKLEKMADKNIDFTIYGKTWHKYTNMISKKLCEHIIYKNIYNDELYEAMCAHKIILNINKETWTSIETGINLRVYEVMDAGNFLLTDYCPELKELFTLGKDLETFRNSEELIDKIKYYSLHDAEREKIAQHEYETIKKYHSWEHRIPQMMQLLEDNL